MYLSEILGVAIGVIFVWLLLSVAVQQVQEWIVGWLDLRADTLQDAVWEMLADPKKRKGPWGRIREQIQKFFERHGWQQYPSGWFVPEKPPAVVQEFYSQPLIKSLTQNNSLPDFIPPETFARALFSVVVTAGTEHSVIKDTIDKFEQDLPRFVHEAVHKGVDEVVRAANDKSGDLAKAIKTFKDNYSNYVEHFESLQGEVDEIRNRLSSSSVEAEINKISSRLVESLGGEIKILKDLANAGKSQAAELDMAIRQFKARYPQYAVYLDALQSTQMPSTPDGLLNQVESGVAKLIITSPELSQLLNGLITTAKEAGGSADAQLARLRSETETWFNNTMDRANGWYKRNRQWGAFAIAFFFAVFLNVDTIDVGFALWRDPVLRRSIEQQAIEQVAQRLPETPTTEDTSPTDTLSDELTNLQVPFGWAIKPIEAYDPARHNCTLLPALTADQVGKVDYTGLPSGDRCISWSSNPTQGLGIGVKLAGILITAFAGMQGAPFWFDMLNKIVNMRVSGKQPDG